MDLKNLLIKSFYEQFHDGVTKQHEEQIKNSIWFITDDDKLISRTGCFTQSEYQVKGIAYKSVMPIIVNSKKFWVTPVYNNGIKTMEKLKARGWKELTTISQFFKDKA